ncbi:MAG TPA: metallophosphoesterase [Thermotogota bacterium]|nr:metallophosphoesterase [Thermotogota bacterium]
MVMICAIGDIHGCYDPLKALINWIEENIIDHCRELEYIFIGDYIDRGPSSREVLDFLIDFNAKKTLLMGNHEDMLMMYHYGSEIYTISGNFWLTENNGGLKTVKALDPSTELDRLVLEETKGYTSSKKHIRNNGEFRLEKKYENFFNSLSYACERTVKTLYGEKRLIFSHSMPNKTVPLQEIMSCPSFEAYHQIRRTYNLGIKETNLWNREFLTRPFEDSIIIHGHTPTFYAEHFMEDILENEKQLSYNTTAIEEGSILFTEETSSGKTLQMDIDTGAVYGRRLSAVFFPETDRELKDLTRKHPFPFSVSYSLGSGYYGEYIEKHLTPDYRRIR